MRSMNDLLRSRRWALGLTAVAGLTASSIAIGLPWDIDMADGQAKKAYSHEMQGIAPGAVAQRNMQSPVWYTPNYERMSPEGQALTSPLEDNEETLAQGERMYNIYCTPCHGDGVNLGTVAQPGRYPGVVALAGPAGVAKLRTDGHIYLTIRNGGAIMPYYSWGMNDDEMWSIVHYVRTMPDAAYIPPEPAEEAAQ